MRVSRIDCPRCDVNVACNAISSHYRVKHPGVELPADEISLRRFDQYWFASESGCHVWTGQVDLDGYARFAPYKALWTVAHRWKYMLLNPGLDYSRVYMDHLCRNRCCVNPDHLEPTSPRENILRGDTVAGRNSRKTHCSKGHKYTTDAYVDRGPGKHPQRVCKECHPGSRARRLIERNVS